MSATQLSDLLPIPSGVSQPNAYQVFGLKGGESDNDQVIMAIKYAYAHLKQTRASADPEVWKRAARIAEQAKKTLEDLELRNRLDHQIEVSKASADQASAAMADPLAGMLPASNPMAGPAKEPPSTQQPSPEPRNSNNAASVLGVTPGSTASLGTPPTAASMLGTPPTGPALPPPAAVASPPGVLKAPSVESAPAMGWTPPKPARKRRKKKSGALLFGLLVVGMLSAIAYLLYFLNENGRIAIGNTPVAATTVADPAPDSKRTPRANLANKNDGVMAGAVTSGVAASLQNPRPGSSNGLGSVAPNSDAIQNAINGQVGGDSMDSSQSGEAMMGQPDALEPTMMVPAMPEPAMPEPAMPEPAMPEPTTSEPEPSGSPSPAVVQASQEKIAAAEQLIRDAKWDQMKPAADALLKLDLNSDQRKRASALYDIADLANYFRGGIVRGLATLQVGNTFEMAKDFPVIVTDVSAQSLSFQYNRVQKSFTIDEMPPTLVERVSSMSLSLDQPDVIAGLALYRLLHPATNDEYRLDAMEQLQTIDGQLEKVDTGAMLAVVKEWFDK